MRVKWWRRPWRSNIACMENSAIGLKSFFSRTRWFKGDKTQSISPFSNITSSGHFAFHKNLKKLSVRNKKTTKGSRNICKWLVIWPYRRTSRQGPFPKKWLLDSKNGRASKERRKRVKERGGGIFSWESILLFREQREALFYLLDERFFYTPTVTAGRSLLRATSREVRIWISYNHCVLRG